MEGAATTVNNSKKTRGLTASQICNGSSKREKKRELLHPPLPRNLLIKSHNRE